MRTMLLNVAPNIKYPVDAIVMYSKNPTINTNFNAEGKSRG